MKSIRALFLMVLLFLTWALRPIVRIRFGSLFVSRLGHLAGNTECYLCERDAGLHGRVFDFWVPKGKPANAYLLKMFSRVMRIAPWAEPLAEVGPKLSWWKGHSFSDAQWGRDIFNLMEKQPPHLRFTRSEERRGQAGLRDLGIPPGAKWVCLIARNGAYLRGAEPKTDYSYHDFRDSEINTYREAAMALIERGFYVVRMGTFCSPMHLSGDRFIDYAVNGMRTEFMDIYLGAKCEFCISNGTGFDGIPMIFRRPICFVNETPFEYLSTWMPDSLAIWKHHEKDGKRMSVEEIIASGAGLFSHAKQYEAAGIKLVDNSPEEIKDVVLEMAGALEDTREPQDWFWAKFPRSRSPHNHVPLHGAIRLRIGQKFLRGYA